MPFESLSRSERRARDQALADFRRKAISLEEWYRDIRAVDSGGS